MAMEAEAMLAEIEDKVNRGKETIEITREKIRGFRENQARVRKDIEGYTYMDDKRMRLVAMLVELVEETDRLNEKLGTDIETQKVLEAQLAELKKRFKARQEM